MTTRQQNSEQDCPLDIGNTTLSPLHIISAILKQSPRRVVFMCGKSCTLLCRTETGKKHLGDGTFLQMKIIKYLIKNITKRTVWRGKSRGNLTYLKIWQSTSCCSTTTFSTLSCTYWINLRRVHKAPLVVKYFPLPLKMCWVMQWLRIAVWPLTLRGGGRQTDRCSLVSPESVAGLDRLLLSQKLRFSFFLLPYTTA